MFKIYDGRETFYQWDLERKLIVADETINQVHFCNRTSDCSLICEVYTEEDIRLVDVPNILLQNSWKINVYGYDSNYTKHSATFEVVERTKPSDYIYTETEVKSYEELEGRIDELESDINSKVDCDVAITEEAPRQVYGLTGVDKDKNIPNRFYVASSPVANRLVRYDSNARLQAKTPVFNSDVATKKYVDDKEVTLRQYTDNKADSLQSSLNYFFEPDDLNGWDDAVVGVYGKNENEDIGIVTTSKEPIKNTIPIYDRFGNLYSNQGWEDTNVVNVETLRYFNTYFMTLWFDNESNTIKLVDNAKGDVLGYWDVNGMCMDSYKLCVIWDESRDDYSKQIIGCRYAWDEEALYFGDDEYKMTEDGTITRLK